jgi:hypothetical protein
MSSLPEYEKVGRVAPMCVDRVRPSLFRDWQCDFDRDDGLFCPIVPYLSGRL